MLQRVLIVEDSSAMRAFVRAALESSGLASNVVEASSGFEALRVLPRERFDFAFVDINMPDIHGLEVIKLMRATPAHRSVPVLVISSEASPRDRERGMALGANGWLRKPFTPAELAQAVHTVLDSLGLDSPGLDSPALDSPAPDSPAPDSLGRLPTDKGRP